MASKGLYLFLRIVQFLVLLLITGLEITQAILYKSYYNDTSKTAEQFYQQYGIKYFYYVVIAVTLLYILITLINFTRQWKTGPHQKIIYIETFFLLLWIAVGFTNIYSMHMSDSKLRCDVNEEIRDMADKITECNAYLASTMIGWSMALLFLCTTIYSIYLWTQRKKIRNQSDQNENENVNENDKDENEP